MPLAAPSWRASFLKRLTKARLMQGNLDGAARAAQTAQKSAAEVDLPFCKAEADRAAAAVALHIGDPARAATLALGAAELNASVGAAMETSRSLILAGRALGAAGDPDRAREVIKQAASDLDERGAVRFRDAAERELRQLGEHIHRRSRAANGHGTGVESLTERELEIARRIVDRRTNREDRRRAVPQPEDRRDAHPQHLRQARCRFARGGGEDRRAGRPGCRFVSLASAHLWAGSTSPMGACRRAVEFVCKHGVPNQGAN